MKKNFSPSATVDTTDAGNISKGTIDPLRLPFSFSGASVGNWQFPAVSSVNLVGGDDGKIYSSRNATGAAVGGRGTATLTVNLPAAGVPAVGWIVGFATDPNKYVVINAGSGTNITYGGGGGAYGIDGSITMPGNTGERVVVQYTGGSSYEILYASRNTLAFNGLESSGSVWDHVAPAGGTYNASLADNGFIISSANSNPLSLVLPASGITEGWTIGAQTDSGHPLTVSVAGGGTITLRNGDTTTSLAIPGARSLQYIIQFSNGAYRVVSGPPNTDLIDISSSVSLQFGGASTGITYTTKSVKYALIGDNLVVISFDILLNNKGTAPGAAILAGLGFTAASSGSGNSPRVSAMAGLTGAVMAIVPIGASYIELSQFGATGVTALDNTNFTNTSRLTGSVYLWRATP